MKLVARHIDKNGMGDVKLMPQAEEDMWHVYNLLAKGDTVTATSFRKIQQTSSTGSSTAQKVKIRLTIEVETIEFDTGTCELRIKGKNTEGEIEIRQLVQRPRTRILLVLLFSSRSSLAVQRMSS
jgi:protein pelota